MAALALENLHSFDSLAACGGIAKHTLRYWYYTNKHQFKETCTIQIGSRIYLDKAAVCEWLRRNSRTLQGEASGEAPTK